MSFNKIHKRLNEYNILMKGIKLCEILHMSASLDCNYDRRNMCRKDVQYIK